MSSSVSQEQNSLDWDHTLPISMELVLTLSDPEVIAELCTRNEGRDRDEYALAALRLGVLALRQARGQLDANALKREGEQLLSSVRSALSEHQLQLHQHLNGSLKEYFDPQSGRFNERVDRLLKKDGDLESLLSRTLTGDQSELQRSLSGLVGRESPLFRLLSPEESNGLLSSLRDAMSQELLQQRQRVLSEFSLDNREGALSRFVGELTDHNGKLRDDLREQIDAVIREFSLDEDNSALSRLVRQVEQAQATISAEFSLDNETSALSRMKSQVESTNSAISRHLTLDDETSALFRLKRELLDVLRTHEDRQRLFQQEVQVTLEKMQTRKATAARSTEHGLEFESQLFDLVNEEAVRAGDLAMFMGDKPGVIRGCKKGDIVVELNIDHVAGGAKIAIEAKEDASYNIKKALIEIDEASKNREAQFGLFVFSRRLAPEGLEAISRHGNAIVIAWDPEDRQTDLFVKLGLSVAKALCTRQAREREAVSVDFSAIDQSLLNINKELTQLEEINTWTTTIQNNSEKILERMRGARKKLDKQILLLQEALLDIRQTLGDDSTGG